MSEMRAGMLTALMYTPCILTGPIWGLLCDYTKRPKLVLMFLALGPAITMFSLPWVARYVHPLSQHKCGASNGTNGMISSLLLQGLSGECQNNAELLFWVNCAIVFVAAIFVFPMNSHAEAMIINVAKHQGADYGRQRVFADLGICVTSYLTGMACQHFNVDVDMSTFSPVFFVFPICSLLMIPLGVVLTDQTKPQQHGEEEEKEKDDKTSEVTQHLNSTGLLKEVIRVCSQLDVFLFLVTAFIAGLMIAIYFNFSFKYLTERSPERSKSACSLVVVVSSLGSVLIFPFTTKLIQLLRGNIPAIIFGLFCGALRFFIMYLDVPFELFVGAQLLNGFSFALLFTAMMEEVFVVSPKEINMTMNSLVMVLFFFVSSLLANIGGSAIYEKYGGAKLFLGTSVTAGVWAVFMMVHYVYRRRVKYGGGSAGTAVVIHNFNNIDKCMQDVV